MSLILSALLAAAVILAVWQFTAARRATRQAADLTMRLSEANDSVNRDAQQISRLEAELEAAHDSLESVRENALSARNSLNDAHERFIAELRKNSDMQIDSLSEQLNEARQTAERLSSLLATTGEENARLKTSLKHFTDQASEREEMLKSQFRNLAGDILRENSMQFKTQNAYRIS
ncbi:MAG: hypothetical protein K2K55_00930 [Duncaniella sp.]|nr:hypothetical protein [Duncaniella sp.]